MSIIHLLEGPVGAGKSTYAKQLCADLGAPHLNLDQWMVTLFRPDRPEENFMAWYAERKDRCIEQIWRVTETLLEQSIPAVLELGLVQAQARQAFYERVDDAGHPLRVYLLEPDRDERWRRVQARNLEQGETYQMTVDDAVFALASDAWESPGREERNLRHIEVVNDS